MPRVVVPLQLGPGEDLPAVCFLTGDRGGDVRPTAVELRRVALAWYSFLFLVAGAIVSEEQRVTVALPLGDRGRARLASTRWIRGLGQTGVVLLLFAPFAYGVYLLLERGDGRSMAALTVAGVVSAVVLMLALERGLVRPRRPVLRDVELGWLLLDVPSAEAAEALAAAGWPRDLDAARARPRVAEPPPPPRRVGGVPLVPDEAPAEPPPAPDPSAAAPVAPRRPPQKGEVPCPACGELLEPEPGEPLEHCYFCGGPLTAA